MVLHCYIETMLSLTNFESIHLTLKSNAHFFRACCDLRKENLFAGIM